MRSNIAIMWKVCLLVTILLQLGVAVKKGSMKRRIAGDFDPDDIAPPEPSSSSRDPAPIRRKGGVLQRLRQDAFDVMEDVHPDLKNRIVDGPFIHDLKYLWGKSKLSSVWIQKLAASAAQSGATGQILDRVAATGSDGNHPKNLFRDLKSLFGLPPGCADMDYIEVPTKSGRKTPHPVFWPHKFFASLYKHRQDIWNNRIVGGDGACRQYWESVADTDFVRQHPFLPRSHWDFIIPVGFHGDGGGFNNHDSLYGLAWNSLLAHGQTIQTRFLFTVMRKSDMVADSLDTVLRAYAWSMNVLLSGETPHQNWLGHDIPGGGMPLAGGYRGTLVQCRGDWQFFCQIFYFPQWNCADVMCPFCRASSTDPTLAWSDTSPTAGWRATRWTHDTYLAWRRGAGLAIPMLFLVIGFRLECVNIDVLHTVDQGIASHIIGSIMWYLAVIRCVFGGRTINEKVNNLKKNMKEWYSKNKVSSKMKGDLTKERLRGNKLWPKLKAQAAATRHLAAYALYLIIEFGTPNDDEWGEHDTLALAVVQLLNRFYEMLKSESMFLGVSARAEIIELGMMLASLYARLAAMSFAWGIKLWKMQPKLHLFQHLCEDQAPLQGNPRYWWTYGDEDLVGILIGIAEGVHPSTIAVSVLFKWAVCVFDQVLVDIAEA